MMRTRLIIINFSEVGMVKATNKMLLITTSKSISKDVSVFLALKDNECNIFILN